MSLSNSVHPPASKLGNGRARAVVTGGAGFIGSHLCDRLLGEGYDVVCIDNLSTGRLENVAHLADIDRFHFMQGDITEGIRISAPVDLVLHFASPASPTDYLRFPVETMKAGSIGTLNALELARENSARFVFASTSAVYGDPQVHPQPESYPGNVDLSEPRAIYCEAKRFGETLTEAYRNFHDTDTAIVRIFNVYGDRMRSNDGRVIPKFISQAIEGAPLTIFGSGSQTRSFTYIDDLMEGIFRMTASGHAGPINIGNSKETSIMDLALLVREIVGSNSPVVFEAKIKGDPRLRSPDMKMAKKILEWEPEVGLRLGLLRMISSLATTTLRVPNSGNVKRSAE